MLTSDMIETSLSLSDLYVVEIDMSCLTVYWYDSGPNESWLPTTL